MTDATGSWSSIAVTDSGTGMSPEVQAQIFEPFFTTKPEGKGTGLGLATVLAIVSECGGRISVDSAPGQGATFTIALPATAAHVTERAVDRTIASGGTERILLVEDDEDVRELSQSILGAPATWCVPRSASTKRSRSSTMNRSTPWSATW